MSGWGTPRIEEEAEELDEGYASDADYETGHVSDRYAETDEPCYDEEMCRPCVPGGSPERQEAELEDEGHAPSEGYAPSEGEPRPEQQQLEYEYAHDRPVEFAPEAPAGCEHVEEQEQEQVEFGAWPPPAAPPPAAAGPTAADEPAQRSHWGQTPRWVDAPRWVDQEQEQDAAAAAATAAPAAAAAAEPSLVPILPAVPPSPDSLQTSRTLRSRPPHGSSPSAPPSLPKRRLRFQGGVASAAAPLAEAAAPTLPAAAAAAVPSSPPTARARAPTAPRGGPFLPLRGGLLLPLLFLLACIATSLVFCGSRLGAEAQLSANITPLPTALPTVTPGSASGVAVAAQVSDGRRSRRGAWRHPIDWGEGGGARHGAAHSNAVPPSQASGAVALRTEGAVPRGESAAVRLARGVASRWRAAKRLARRQNAARGRAQ